MQWCLSHVVAVIPSHESSYLMCKQPPFFILEKKLHGLKDDISNLRFC